MESDADPDTAREVYERAIANIPPIQEKRHWRRYIYLWINYALYEELEVKVSLLPLCVLWNGYNSHIAMCDIVHIAVDFSAYFVELAGPGENKTGVPGMSGSHPSQKGIGSLQSVARPF